MRTAYVVLIAAGSLCVGVVIGGLLTRKWIQSYSTFSDLARIAMFASYVDTQRYEGTPAAYEAVLNDYLHELNSRAMQSSEFVPARIIVVDRALTYARLSEVQNQRGASQESSRSLASAAALCPQLQWKSCSGPEILAMAKRLDEHSIFRPKEGEANGR
jgi:hypothetical protein